jgi:hypothetical protein
LKSVEPLLCNDREMGGYTRAVSGQRLGNHVTATTDTNATMVKKQRNGVFCGALRGRCYATVRCTHLYGNEFRHNNRRSMFPMWSVPRFFKQRKD